MDFADYAGDAVTQSAIAAASTIAGAAAGYYKQHQGNRTMPVKSKAIRKLQRRVARNTPETKCKHIYGNLTTAAVNTVDIKEITLLTQDIDSDERIGRKIRIVGWKLRTIGPRDVDLYILKSYDDHVPVYGDFAPIQGGHLDQSAKAHLVEMAYLIDQNSTSIHNTHNKRFKAGLPVVFDSTLNSSCIKNRLHLVMKNNSSTGIQTVKYSMTLYYTDA